MRDSGRDWRSGQDQRSESRHQVSLSAFKITPTSSLGAYSWERIPPPSSLFESLPWREVVFPAGLSRPRLIDDLGSCSFPFRFRATIELICFSFRGNQRMRLEVLIVLCSVLSIAALLRAQAIFGTILIKK